MVLVAAFRYDVGTDFLMYENFFRNAESLPWFSLNLEFIFILICKFAYFLTQDSVLFFFIIAIWIYYFVFNICLFEDDEMLNIYKSVLLWNLLNSSGLSSGSSGNW